MRIITIFLICLFLGCGSNSKKVDPADLDEGLDLIAKKKVALLKERLDPVSGWVSHRDCDSLLWNGKLLAVEAFFDIVKIDVAEYASNGRYNRREFPPCYDTTKDHPDQGSASTISNDMLLGLMIGLYTTKNLEALKRLAEYGEKHNWVMGDPFPKRADRVVLRPNGIGLLGRMLFALSNGDISKTYRHWPSLYNVPEKSYQRHLTALGIYIQGEVSTYLKEDPVVKDWESVKLTENDSFSGISNKNLNILKGLTDKEPNNALFWVIRCLYDGNIDPGVSLLKRQYWVTYISNT